METDVIERAPIPELTRASVEAALRDFEGEQSQIPPMHSALKFEGKRLYELARRGESVERSARRIVLRDLHCVSLTAEVVEFDVHCSKGTYIRTLAADFAARLGTLGYVEGLRRLSVDPFGAYPSHTLEALLKASAADRDALLLGADAAFADLPRVDLNEGAEKRVLLGQTVSAAISATFAGEARAYGPSGRFVGLVVGQPGGHVRALRLFTAAAPGGDGRMQSAEIETD
jgi:tRNA pseudouridine55 synthase